MKNHEYRDLGAEAQEELFSNFLIDSWSYSKVSSFSRNEKAFEMTYIYGQYGKSGASTIAGEAYHEAMQLFFESLKEGELLTIVELQRLAFDYIDSVEVGKWKIQKTTPSIEECKKKATKIVIALLENLFAELSVYKSEIKEILDVELYLNEFVTINGVDIPLPIHGKIDLAFISNENKRVLLDHKSKNSHTDRKELKFTIAKQAISYVAAYEVKTGLPVDEVWFVENKYSKNRDNTPQLACFKVTVDADTRRLYEALLYEPLKKMLEAVSNPDYVYVINDNDSFVDKAEIYEFWAQTMISEVEAFNVLDSKKELVSKRLKKIRDVSLATVSPDTIKKFKSNASQFIQYDLSNKDMKQEEKIEHTLRSLGTLVNVAHKIDGFAADTFLLEVSAGTNLSTVHRYKLDIANALNVPSVRIQKDLFVYEGKSYLAVEASKKRTKDLFYDEGLLKDRRIPIGMDNFQNVIHWDLDNHSTPHMLICGATGSGKSAAIISMLEYIKKTDIDRVVIFDPKFEFVKKAAERVEVYNEIEEIETMMELLVEEMQNMAKTGIQSNVVIVFDEFADAVSQSRKGKDLDVYEDVECGFYKQSKSEILLGLPPQPKLKRQKVGTKNSLEDNLKMLLQKGRSLGFRIIAATQRASVKVITGDAKVNFPVQVCFRVPKEIDSKVVLDEVGAEALTGRGDGLINSPEYNGLVRFQSFFKPE